MTNTPPVGSEQPPLGRPSGTDQGRIGPPLSKRDAKAQLAAAKAYSKSQRSWLARHKVLTGLGAIVVVIVVVIVAVSAGSSTKSSSTQIGAGSSAAAGIGTPVRDGKFEFTVTAGDPGKATIGTAPLTATAQGKFVEVHLSIKNIGTKQQLFDQTSQKMLDQQGRELSSDPTSAVYVDSGSFLAQINPGNSIKGILVFDVPKDAVPTKLELHDSAFSGGVTVQL